MFYAAIIDASHRIGTGHLMRQISLAHSAIKVGINPILISWSPLASKICKLNDVPFIYAESIENINEIIESNNITKLIIDVYQKDFNLFRPLCDHLNSVLIVSEEGYEFPPFGNHIVKIGSDLHEWDCLIKKTNLKESTNIHSGRAWMIFNDKFNSINIRSKHEPDTILICHGGSDPFGLTLQCLKSLEQTQKRYMCNILITENFSEIDKIYSLSQISKHECNVIMNSVNPEYWMCKSKIAMINGGNVRYELCITQTPFIAISFKPEQYRCTEQITAIGAGVNLGLMNEINEREIANATEELIADNEEWSTMHNIMGKLFDLEGCNRILDLLLE